MRKELLSPEEGKALGVDVVIVIYDARQRIQSLSSRTDLDKIRHTVWQVCCSSLDVPPPSHKAPSLKSNILWSDIIVGTSIVLGFGLFCAWLLTTSSPQRQGHQGHRSRY
jgi:hypothetical protein